MTAVIHVGIKYTFVSSFISDFIFAKTATVAREKKMKQQKQENPTPITSQQMLSHLYGFF